MEKSFVQFNLALDAAEGNETQSISVTDNGQKFSVTGYGGGYPAGSIAGLRTYQAAYRIEPGAAGEKIDPATYTNATDSVC